MTKPGELTVHKHGSTGPVVIVLHGGPAAAGSAAPLARGLADSFRVLEPWQRGRGTQPLTVQLHISDLHELVHKYCRKQRPAIVGESWGAMLALAYAAEYPRNAGPLVLVGCGTFDEKSRKRLRSNLSKRMDERTRGRIEAIEANHQDAEERLMKKYELTRHLYNYDPSACDDKSHPVLFDMRAHTDTWNDMLQQQKEGVYPSSFASINSPVLMIHGAQDPHPGRMIEESLRPHLPQLEYQELEKCGHSPWLERAARDEFFVLLRDWLMQNIGDDSCGR